MNNKKRTFNPIIKNTTRFSQSENADLVYSGNWAAVVQGETISASTWIIESGSVTITNEANTATATSAQIVGEPGESIIINKVTLSDGSIDEHKILLQIRTNDTPVINRDYGFC